jgi:hypothetical protein
MYSLWYNGPLKKANVNKNQSNITEEQAVKRAKMVVSNINKDHAHSPEVLASVSGTAQSKNPIQDLDNTLSLGIEQDVPQIGGKSGSKPKVRLLARKDPL